MLKYIALFLLVVVAGLAGTYFYVSNAAQKLPENSPAQFLAKSEAAGKKVVVCVGDSITHGRVSCNYVDLLTEKLAPQGYALVNAGINSQLAWNVLQRMDEVVACRPDVVTVMIGTNDANATLTEENMKRYQRQMKLPRKADRAWYRLNLEKIVTVLKTRTRARIALISLPPIGEALDHASYQRAAAYSQIVREVAEKGGVAYIPLNESMDEYLRAHPHQPLVGYDDNPRKLLYGVLVNRFLMGKSWDEISRDRGLLLLTDTLHLNCLGAAMAADQIGKFVLAQ